MMFRLGPIRMSSDLISCERLQKQLYMLFFHLLNIADIMAIGKLFYK